LSHAETLRLLQRACVRAGIDIRYSQGFNPHPRMSLPLPRPVGVESDCELLTLRASRRSEIRDTRDEARVMESLSSQLPEGLELISVDFAGAKSSFEPCSATYIFSVRPELLDDRLQGRIDGLMASENLFVRRMFDKTKSKSRNINVRSYLSSIELEGADIIVECSVTPAGSIRVQEVMEMLELDEAMLASPVRRTNIQWRDV
ncbi:MAG: DUF2344 domain-containing protein, partial [Sedimentisphaerales bacterium]|nr:DUF2344 domain-containing protein [Sedimentisphaerales bacterium]